MSQSITLLGTEDLTRAARTISEAADQLARIQGWESERLDRHEAFMAAWLDRLESVLEEAKPASRPNTGPL